MDVKDTFKTEKIVFTVILLCRMKVGMSKVQHIAIFVWTINSEFIITEELVELIPLQGSVTGMVFLMQLNLRNCVSVIAYGAPITIDPTDGWKTHLEKPAKEIANKHGILLFIKRL